MAPTPVPVPPPIPIPRLDLRIHPLTHPALNLPQVLTPALSLQLQGMIRFILSQLYHDPWNKPPQKLRSITIFLRPMDGIAYTTGSWVDDSDKEVHVSLDYILKNPSDLQGVLVHELVSLFLSKRPRFILTDTKFRYIAFKQTHSLLVLED
jgi:hypothetical protein